MSENERFESFLLIDPDLKFHFRCIFLCGMGITSCRLGCFILTMCMMMRPFGTSLLIPLSLWTSHGLVEFFIAMMKLNKYVLELFFFLPTLS